MKMVQLLGNSKALHFKADILKASMVVGLIIPVSVGCYYFCIIGSCLFFVFVFFKREEKNIRQFKEIGTNEITVDFLLYQLTCGL